MQPYLCLISVGPVQEFIAEVLEQRTLKSGVVRLLVRPAAKKEG